MSMTTGTIIKGLLILVAVVLIYGYLRKRTNTDAAPVLSAEEDVFFDMNKGNQAALIFAPAYDKQWFEELDKKYSWDKFDPYNNKFFQYTSRLCDTLTSLSNGLTIFDEDFFYKMTRGQKILYIASLFAAETDNGGVYQFFFNNPWFRYAALETFKELKLDTLSKDYKKCLDEFVGSIDSFMKRKEIFDDSANSREKQWAAFKEGYAEVPSAKTIEQYFYKDEFKKQYYKAVVDYVDQHLDQFVKK